MKVKVVSLHFIKT